MPNDTKLIREGRFGPPKCFKTGAVIGSYPKPMLVLMFDDGGLDVLPSKTGKKHDDLLTLDSFIEDVVWVNEAEFEKLCTVPSESLPRITAIDLFSSRAKKLDDLFIPAADSTGLQTVVRIQNLLTTKGCPWKTIVTDPITGLSETIHAHEAKMNPTKLADYRKWTPDVGYMVCKYVSSICLTRAHAVFIFHDTDKTNEAGATIATIPMLPSKFGRDRIGGLLQQWFYATKDMGKPIVVTSDYGLLRGLGARWPLGLPTKCGPLYKDIYER